MRAVVGALRAVLGMDTVAFEEGIGRAQKQLSRFSREFSKIGGNIERMGRTASVAITAPILAVGTVGLRAAANFEEGMNRVAAATQASSKELEQLSSLARTIGKTTQFSATEAAGALEGLAKNGLNVTQILDGAALATVKLAQANGAQLEPAANIVTDVMQQFGKQSGDLSGVVDQVTGTLIASKLGFDDYRLAIGQAGGVAGKVGVTFEDFNAALAATSASFASGSDAGTSFKTFLTRLAPDSKEAKETMSALGLSFFDATGRMVTMAEAAGRLQKAFAPLSDKARIEAATKIFGTDAMRTALALADQGAAGIRRVQAEIAKVDAGEQAATRMQGFNGALRTLRSAFEALSIAIGQSGLLEFMTRLVEQATKATLALSNLNPEILKWGTIMAGVAAAIGPLALSVGFLVKSFGPLLVMVSRIAPAFAPLLAMAAPWALLVAGIAAATAALVIFGDQIPLSADGAITLADGLAAVAVNVDRVKRAMADWEFKILSDEDMRALDEVVAWFGKIGSTLTLTAMVEQTAKEIDAIIGLFSGMAKAIEAIWQNIGPVLAEKIGEMANGVLRRLTEWANGIIRIANWAGQKLGRDPIKYLEAPEIGVATGAWAKAGQDIAKAFEAGFGARIAQGYLDQVVADAANAALDRRAGMVGETGGSPMITKVPSFVTRPTGGAGGGRGGADLPGGGGGGKGDKGDKALDKLKEFLAANERAVELERMSAQQRAISEALYKAEELAKDANRKLTEGETEAIKRNVIALQAAKKETEEKQRLEALAKTTIEDVKTSQEKYNDVLRDLNLLLAQGAISQDQFDKARKLAIEKMRGDKGEWSTQWAEFADAVSNAARDTAKDLLSMEGDVGDILSRLLKRIAEFALEILVLQPIFDQVGKMIKEALNPAGSSSTSGGILGGIISGIGSLFGSAVGAGTSTYGSYSPVAGSLSYGGPRAGGGPVDVGAWYRINEMGTEAFVPQVPGTIINHRDLADMADSSGTVVQQNQFSLGLDTVAKAAIARELPKIQRAAIEAVETTRRRGGRFKGAFNR